MRGWIGYVGLGLSVDGQVLYVADLAKQALFGGHGTSHIC